MRSGTDSTSTSANSHSASGSLGSVFAPIYRRHPWVGRLVLCDGLPQKVDDLRRRLGSGEFESSLDEVLAENF